MPSYEEPIVPLWVRPELSQLLKVEKSTEEFGSGARSLVDLPAGSLFARITTASPARAAYTTVQVGENAHIELNSNLVYANHSCDPSLVFDMERFEVRVAPDRPLKVDDPLTFFYPSTEWEMAQPFDCTCGAAEKCRGWIGGAKFLQPEDMRNHYVNPHILKMMKKRDGMNGTH